MNLESAPIAALSIPPIPTAAAPARPTAKAASAADAAVNVDTLPASPPPEVEQAMAVAAGQYDKLKAAGHQLSFSLDEGTGTVRISVHDLKGDVLFTIPPASALEVASGGSLQ
jgi:uncharacterized FlaG/YvyC family protein